ncbi:hypothetical protein KA005_58615, partial [bacterium]|nr:hypothetical protein [bacterium]
MKKGLVLLICISITLFLHITVSAGQGDAENGAKLFSQNFCVLCHGASGEGFIGPSLIGCSVCDSQDSLFNKIDSDMPLLDPSLCVDDCAHDVAAYVFEVLNGEGTGGICATEAIYGEYSPETEILRGYRDNILSKTSEGQEIIRLYYEWSPVIV